MNTAFSNRFSLAALFALAFFGVLALTNCGEGGGASQSSSVPVTITTPTPNPAIEEPPPGSIYLGIYVNPTQTASPPTSLLADFESSIGRHVALSPHYYSFYDTFPGPYEADDLANGRIPIDSWNCQPPNAAIAAGTQDNAIRARADAIKAWGHPIFLRYMWEMNLPASPAFRQICYDPNTDLPNGVFSPQNYIAAWKRIRAIFDQEGVTNVVWLWNPSGTVNPIAYYPGSAETDWVGFDKYDIVNESVDLLYKQPYAWLLPLGKPILISETGANAVNQVTFLQTLPGIMQTQYPQIKGFVYFDSQKGNVNSWVIGPSSIPAFATMASSPYMSAMPKL